MTHRRLHKELKPDETAEGLAFAAARKNPAANQNAQSIVIHSLHRPGAPGIDRPAAKVAAQQPTPLGHVPVAVGTPASASSATENRP